MYMFAIVAVLAVEIAVLAAALIVFLLGGGGE